MKKLYLLLLFVSISFVSAFADGNWQVSYTDEKGATWEFYIMNKWDNQTYQNVPYAASLTKVTNYGDEITVPATVTYNEVEYPVEQIESSVFKDNKSVTKIILPTTILNIGYQCFKGCSSLVEVANTSNCEYVNSEAFRDCISLTHIDLSSCKRIEWGAFANCNSLQDIVSLSNIEYIRGSVFDSCKSLKEVDLPSGVEIGDYAFNQCTNLTKIGSLDNATISNGAFSNCNALKSIDLSKTKSIGEWAFGYCYLLGSVGDLSNIAGLDNYVFNQCWSLTEVDLSSCKSIGKSTFGGCKKLNKVTLGSCLSMAEDAFCETAIQSIDLSTVKSLGPNAFGNCTKLESVGNLSNLQTIESRTFQNCSSLKEIDLSTIQSIGEYAFYGCTRLGNLTIESTCINSVGSNAFNHTGTLTFMQATPFAISEDAFGEYLLIKVPAASLDAYQTADVWKDFANRIFAIGDTFDFEIEVEAKDNTSSLQAVIGKDNLRKVVSLKVTGSINSYDIMIIRNQTPNLHYLDLTDANIVECSQEYYTGSHSQNNIVGDNMFRDLTKLLTIKLPRTTTSIGSCAFSSCSNLQDITMYEGIKTLGGETFNSCSQLKDIILPNGLESIGSWAFSQCYKLENVAFPNGLISIGSYAFYWCGNLRAISLPTSLKTISNHAFQGCSNLQEVKIPSSITNIYENAFSGCNLLNKVYTYTIEPTSINQNTFSTYSTATLYVPKTSYDNYYWDTEWNQFSKLEEFDEPYSYFYINKDYTLDEDERIDGTPDADLNPGGSLTVEGEDNQNIDDLTVISDGDSGQSGSVIADDNINANWLKFEIKVVPNKWYFFGFPFRILLSNITFDKEDVNYVFRYYDGAARAENGNGGWKNLPADAEALERGVGYIFQCNKAANLILKVEKPEFTAENVEQTLEEHESAQAQNAGWNFIGNPHISYYDINDTEYSAPITIWNGTSYEAIRPIDDDYFFHPFQGFFVQKPDNKDKVKFNKDDRTSYLQSQKKNKAAQTRRMTRGIDQERLLVELTIADTETRDKTRIVFNEKATTGYETLCDAAKFMSTEDVPQIYTLDNEGAKYAINERPAGEVKVGYLVKTAGTYKIAAARMDKSVTLYDDVTKTEFDFTNGDYTFESEAGTFDNRFTLKIPAGASTGLAEIKSQTGVNVMGNADGILISNVGDAMVDIYSLAGVQLATGVRDGFVSLPKATYIVKVNNISSKVMVK